MPSIPFLSKMTKNQLQTLIAALAIVLVTGGSAYSTLKNDDAEIRSEFKEETESIRSDLKDQEKRLTEREIAMARESQKLEDMSKKVDEMHEMLKVMSGAYLPRS